MSWAEIKKAINSNISKSLDLLITEKSNEISTSIGNNNSLISSIKSLLENTTYGLNAIKTTVNSVNNTVSVVGNIPSVKSVQRGVAYFDSSKYYTMDITISNVNPDKSIVLLDSCGCLAYVGRLSSTILTIKSEYTGDFSWQVIEFY